MSDPATLLNDYNDYLVRTAHWRKLSQTRPVGRRRMTRENLAAMEQLAAWCQEHGVEPRLWIYSLFEARRWTFAPPFGQLRSEAHLKRFAERRGSSYFSNRVQRELTEAETRDHAQYDPNRDLSGTVENLKRYYLDSGNAAVCRAEIQKTLGFHPRSFVCARCPEAAACASALQAMVPFDIQALRRGEITAEHAQQVAMLNASRS